MTILDTLMYRLGRRDHYATHGKNAAIVVRSKYKAMASLGVGSVSKITTLSFRKGREDEGEAVQAEIVIDQLYDSGRKSAMSASISFSPEVWSAIVEWVKENRTVED